VGVPYSRRMGVPYSLGRRISLRNIPAAVVDPPVQPVSCDHGAAGTALLPVFSSNTICNNNSLCNNQLYMISRNIIRFLVGAITFGTVPSGVEAAGGYFAIGYGPKARQLAGATTAVADDAFTGSSNPGKLFAAGNRTDVGADIFMPYRRVERTGSNSIYDFSTTSDKGLFLIPEAAFSRRINGRWAWGLTLYGNGGLNTDYRGDNGTPGSSFAPGECGNLPANFFFGCGKAGIDIMQLVVAPGVAYQIAPGHTIGIAPLLTAQRFKAYGFQAFAGLSKLPTDVTNRGKDWALGAGVRVGWFGEITPWLNLGAAYASKVYMDKFEKYEGLLAEGSLDIPANFSVGLALMASERLTFSFDYQRINFGDVKAVSNGVLNTLLDPAGQALGTSGGSGFNWGNQDNFRFGLAYAVTPAVTLRGGYAYGERPQRGDGINSVTFNMLTPTAENQFTAGFSWQPRPERELNFAYVRFIAPDYAGPSASSLLGVGGTEHIAAHVDTVMLSWSWKR